MTADAILVVNAGSSSLKTRVFGASPELPLLAAGRITGIGARTEFTWNENVVVEFPAKLDHAGALREFLGWLNEREEAWRLRAVGHRIVHGGTQLTAPTRLTPGVVDTLETLIPLAPLHQPVGLAVVRAFAESHPDLPQFACFDTAFHANQAEIFRNYAIPKHLRDQGVRRYGFHGLSYEWVAQELARSHPQLAGGRVVAAHLGAGASLCAMRAGKSVDTTMGMTALDGLPMATRCGSIDPGVVLYLLRVLNLSAARVEEILSYESGLAGLSGVGGDVRDLLASDAADAAFALEYFFTMTAQHVARMAVALEGIDALVFTGGIGEHAPAIRDQIVRRLALLDPFDVVVIPANEERVIAQHCWSLMSEPE